MQKKLRRVRVESDDESDKEEPVDDRDRVAHEIFDGDDDDDVPRERSPRAADEEEGEARGEFGDLSGEESGEHNAKPRWCPLFVIASVVCRAISLCCVRRWNEITRRHGCRSGDGIHTLKCWYRPFRGWVCVWPFQVELAWPNRQHDGSVRTEMVHKAKGPRSLPPELPKLWQNLRGLTRLSPDLRCPRVWF